MIAKSYILENLNRLDRLFKKSTSIKEGLFYSKLAILELCGWIEESMDDIIRRVAKRYFKNVNNNKYLEDIVIGRTYGFEYRSIFDLC